MKKEFNDCILPIVDLKESDMMGIATEDGCICITKTQAKKYFNL